MAQHLAQAVPLNAEQLGSEHVVLLAFPLLGKHAAVRTTHKEVADSIETYKSQLEQEGRPYMEGLYRHIFRIAGAYQMELEDDTEDKRQAWVDFCNDVVILYTMRYALTGQHIHVTTRVPD